MFIRTQIKPFCHCRRTSCSVFALCCRRRCTPCHDTFFIITRCLIRCGSCCISIFSCSELHFHHPMSEPDSDFDSGLGSDFDSVPDSAPILLSGSALVSAVNLPLIDLPMSYHLHNTIRYVCVLFFRKSAVRHSHSIHFCMAMLFLTTDCLSLQRDCRENQRIVRTENNYTGQTQNHLSPPF